MKASCGRSDIRRRSSKSGTKFEENNGIVGAYLMQRSMFVVRKPVMDFAATDRGNPLEVWAANDIGDAGYC
jgi:hypothetical protein